MKKIISILGSTGSIGLSALKIVDKKKSIFEINLLSANKNYKSICTQIKKYKPKIFVITNAQIYQKIKIKFKKSKTNIFQDFRNIIKIKKNNITISAISGIAGLQPTLKMMPFTKNLLIANK